MQQSRYVTVARTRVGYKLFDTKLRGGNEFGSKHSKQNTKAKVEDKEKQQGIMRATMYDSYAIVL